MGYIRLVRGVREVGCDPRSIQLMRLCCMQHRFRLYVIALNDQLDGGQAASVVQLTDDGHVLGAHRRRELTHTLIINANLH